MSKFKKGDRVRNLEAYGYVPKGATGTVDENDSPVPFVIWDEVTEYALKNSAPNGKMRWAQEEASLELIPQVNTNDPLGIIGRKMKGFKFETMIGRLSYDMPEMDNYIGLEAEIVYYDGDNDSYKCQFPDDYWYYPAELIMQHIVDTPQDNQQDTPKELTLLEKFEQGWHITDSYGDKMIAVYKAKNSDKIIVEWFSGVIGDFDLQDLNATWLTCTPPKERKTLYLYEGDGKVDFFASSAKTAEFNLISEIHLEKNGDKWEVVNP